jgi:hypothetical protein
MSFCFFQFFDAARVATTPDKFFLIGNTFVENHWKSRWNCDSTLPKENWAKFQWKKGLFSIQGRINDGTEGIKRQNKKL